MAFRIRPPHPEELPALSDLCLRSKAYWGYDAGFLDACREELTLSVAEMSTSRIGVGDMDGAPVAVAQVGLEEGEAHLLKFFVDPPWIGKGIGRPLLAWCTEAARDLGAAHLVIEADPGAAPFYEHMGAQHIGQAPSGSIPGRVLPVLSLPIG